MKAGFEVFRAFDQDAEDFKELAKTKLKMPMLVLTGERASGDFLIQQARMVADNVEGVIDHRLGPLADGRGARPGRAEAGRFLQPLTFPVGPVSPPSGIP